MSLGNLKKKATDLGIKGVMKRGKFTKHNKDELCEIIGKAEASGCRVLNSVKDLDIPSIENVTCEKLIEVKDNFEKDGFHTQDLEVGNKEKVPSFNGGMALVGIGFLAFMGFSSWYFFPAKKVNRPPDVKHYEQHI